MLRFLVAGGWSTWMVLILGGTCLAIAALFARRPEAGRLPLLRAMTWATVFAVLAGVAANFTATLARAGSEESTARGSGMELVLTGGAESLTSAILGFSLLTLAWMFVAIGMRRMQNPEP